jgi:hypothetical protein
LTASLTEQSKLTGGTVHDLLDPLTQAVEPSAATNLGFRTTYQN